MIQYKGTIAAAVRAKYSTLIYPSTWNQQVSKGDWHALRITFAPPGVIEIYVDEILLYSGTRTLSDRSNDWILTLGNFDGFIDEVRISDTVRQGEQPIAKPVIAAVVGGIGVKNYPNPFNSETVVSYSLQGVDEMRLGVHNILGQEVRVLDQGIRAVGEHSLVWDGRDEEGKAVASGVYILRLQVRRQVFTHRLMLLR